MKHFRSLSAILCLLVLSGLTACSSSTASSAQDSSSDSSSAATVTESVEASSSVSSAPQDITGFELLEGLDTFDITSGDLKEDVWADVISNTSSGENKSPDLSWEPVDGAGLYVIYMVDGDAGNWIHWISDAVTETSLQEGQADSKEYVGPYPPAGQTHTYEVYVFALKSPPEKIRGIFNGPNHKFEEYITTLNTDANGNSGNVTAYGKLSGKYTNK